MSRNSTHTIMNHQGFGDVKLKSNDVTLIIPHSLITREGNIYKRVSKSIYSKDYDRLEHSGVIIEK